jgi:hypothetical protein
MTYKYLTVGNDAKTIKGQKKGYLTGILYLAPATVAGGRTVCPFSTAGCRRVCLYTAGRGGFNVVQQARIRKTREWFSNPAAFLAALEQDIAALIKDASGRGFIPAVRLNGTSDIEWEKHGIMQKFPQVQFYDYTKWPANRRWNLPPNYHLTYSFSEKKGSDVQAMAWRLRGFNTAMVFNPHVPKAWRLTPESEPVEVINGDESDLRFTDPKRVIVGLKTKGKARKDDGDGFVQDATGVPALV